MQTPNPDPASRPPEPKPGGGSTGSHRQPTNSATGSSLSDLLRANAGMPSRRASAAADLAAQLMNNGSSYTPPASDNTDDAPTIITANRALSPVPPPPYVVGEMQALTGRRLGHFELIEAIGAGGMAAVLKARDLDLGRIVALKILPPESAQDPENVSRFKQEARAAAKLDHENVARVYFCGEDQGLHFIAFEFVEGPNLRGLIDRRGPLPAGESVAYMIQIAAGLAHASERGVVHRDIKPSNIIITPSGRAKIVDMGLARLDANPVNGGMTQSGVTLGTFDYISPEQALDPRRADVRSDLYSLGCTFYHALTGRPPVPEGTAAKKLHAHQHVDPLDPRELNPAVPDALAIVLARMMAKDPDRRYQSPAELIADLKRLIDPSLGIAAFTLSDSVVRAIPASESVMPPAPRLPLMALLAVAAVILVVAALALNTSSDSAIPPPSWANNDPGTKKGPATNGTPEVGSTARGFVKAGTVEELKKRLGDAAVTHIRLTGKEYDLSEFTKAIQGQPDRTLQIDAATNEPPVLTLAAAPLDAADPDREETLTFVGFKSVSIQGVRFRIVRPQGTDDGTGPSAALAAIDVGRFTLTDCRFELHDAELKSTDTAAVAVTRTRDDFTPQLHLERCLVLPGAVGVGLCLEAELTIDDSGFAPQTVAAVQIRSEGESDPATTTPALIRISRSSFLFDPRSALVQSDGQVRTAVTASYCVFAPTGAENAEPTAGRGVLVRVEGESPDRVEFHGEDGKKNAYFQLDALAWNGKAYTFEECKQQNWPIEDRTAVALARLPWDVPPTAAAWDKLAEAPRSFRLRFDPDLEVNSEKDRTVKFVGVCFAVPGKADGLTYEAKPFVPPAEVASNVKVWWPAATEEQADKENAFKDLVVLLRAARSGDTILVRHDGLIDFEPVTIKPRRAAGEEKPGELSLTFKPYEANGRKFHPVFRTHDVKKGAAERVDEALLTIEDAEVSFENIEFRLTAGGTDGVLSRQAVALMGARGCSFRSCAFTLDEDGGKAAVVLLADADGRMMGPAASRPTPHIRFDDCLVRGEGRLLAVPSSRAFDLTATNCVIALNGAVLAIDPAGRAGGDAVSHVRLSKVTALLGGSILDLRAGKAAEGVGTMLVPTHVEADECLFAAVPNSGRPLLEVDGVSPSELAEVLTWGPPRDDVRAKPNWYANFDPSTPFATFNLAATGMPQKEWVVGDWLFFVKAVGTPTGKVTFKSNPTGVRALGTVLPADLAVKAVDFANMGTARVGDAGANVETVAKPLP